MKRKIYTGKNLIFLAALWLLGGCSDQFLQDKKDFNGFNEEIYDDYALAQGKVDYLYSLCSPANNAKMAAADEWSKTTEEYGSESVFNQATELLTTTIDDYFFKKTTDGPWSRIREANIFLDNIDKGSLSKTERDELKGQVYFWRAWLYFDLVKKYGGVPLILHAQNAILGGDSSDDLKVKRSKTSECITQICADLDSATVMLPGRWEVAAEDWGRITSGAAAALKGRVLLTWASPLFNRNDDVTRWQAAYDANKKAKDILDANGFGLVDAKSNRAKAWGQMFASGRNENKEIVFAFLFNKSTNDQTKHNNGWENTIRPKDANGTGGVSATAEMVDMFPMADGSKPTEETYNATKFYKNRDPRFYRTFAFNGCVWPYKENASFTLWTYRWYKDDKTTGEDQSGISALYQGANNTDIFVRKGSADVNASSTDKYVASEQPFIELRYAEVVLNLAEAAVGIGQLSEGYNGITSLRERVGIPVGSNKRYGVEDNLDRDGLFAAILYERQIEFAYEAKRFWDAKRWMLFNDDAGDQFGGNTTCARLGVQPLNGTRRHGIYLMVKPEIFTSTKSGMDADVLNPKSSNVNTNLVTRTSGLNPDDSDDKFEAAIKELDKFYEENLLRVTWDKLDKTSPRFEFNWLSKYYFLGLSSKVFNNSPYLEQTMGWTDLYGGAGTFNPIN